MHSHEINADLKARGLNFSIVADALGVTPQHVSRVAARHTHSHRVAEALAKALRKPVTEVFPDVEEYRTPRPDQSRDARVAALRKELAA